jgi:glycosyltransferase involved in cell wall biosynthesis
MLIDITRLVHRRLRGRLPTGIDRVSLAYVERYGERASALLRFAGSWRVLGRQASQSLFNALTERHPRSWPAFVRCLVRGLTARAEPRQRHRLLINTGHSGLEHARYARELQRRQLRGLYVLHDLIPITHPQFARPVQERRHRRRLQTMLGSARVLVVNSRATRAELAAHARQLGSALPDCVVAPLAPAALPEPALQAPLAAPYFVVLGTLEPRKNHQLLLRLWRRLGEELGSGAPRLIVIGQPGWGSAPTVRQLRRCPELRRLVTWHAHCTDGELATWLAHARALLFPSLAEGYGLPLVEALSLRVPVLASGLPAFRELAGEIPEFLDPADERGWHGAVLDYSDPEGLRPRLQRARMAAFVAPEWAAHFDALDAVIDECVREESPRPAAGAPAIRDWAYASRA